MNDVKIVILYSPLISLCAIGKDNDNFFSLKLGIDNLSFTCLDTINPSWS